VHKRATIRALTYFAAHITVVNNDCLKSKKLSPIFFLNDTFSDFFVKKLNKIVQKNKNNNHCIFGEICVKGNLFFRKINQRLWPGGAKKWTTVII
jgi:hypothetical protein